MYKFWTKSCFYGTLGIMNELSVTPTWYCEQFMPTTCQNWTWMISWVHEIYTGRTTVLKYVLVPSLYPPWQLLTFLHNPLHFPYISLTFPSHSLTKSGVRIFSLIFLAHSLTKNIFHFCEGRVQHALSKIMYQIIGYRLCVFANTYIIGCPSHTGA